VFTSEEEETTEEVPLGVYIIRGDNIVRTSPCISLFTLIAWADVMESPLQALIGEVDTEVENQIDWTTVKADPIDEVVH
jgi:hypothetical protein